MTCDQLFTGKKLMYTKAYVMSTEYEGPDKLQEFLAKLGAQYHMHNYNAHMKNRKLVKDFIYV